MARIYVSGLVKRAGQVRQALAGPISPDALAQLKARLTEYLADLHAVLAAHGATPDDLPTPSRTAYRFLSGLDLGRIKPDDSVHPAAPARGSLHFPKLASVFEGILDVLARAESAAAEVAAVEDGAPVVDGPRAEAARASSSAGRQALLFASESEPRSEQHPVTESKPGSKARVSSGRGSSGPVGSSPAEPAGDVISASYVKAHASLLRARDFVESQMKEHRCGPEALIDRQRPIWAWLSYFATPAHFQAYVEALRRARGPFAEAIERWVGRPVQPVIHFRPQRVLYRTRSRGDDVTIKLPVPMIALTGAQFDGLARSIFEVGGDRSAVLGLTELPGYRRVRERFDALLGHGGSARGATHDLTASFERVNGTYFAGAMSQPKLRWSDRFAGRRFGTYDFASDEIQINCVLDTPEVPAYLVDFVMYHELLHKAHGLDRRNGRCHAHTPAFRRDERRFAEFDRAQAMLERLASR